MTTHLISFNGTTDIGQFLGDQLCSIKAAYLLAQNYPCDKLMLAMSPSNQLHFFWQKFIDDFDVEVVYDTFHPGNMDQRFQAWDLWRHSGDIEGRKFDRYFELYRRIDGAKRQAALCGGEKGLCRKNIFEYFYYGQAGEIAEPIKNGEFYDSSMIYHPTYPADRGVFVAPYAKCQGNHVFTLDGYWPRVVKKLIDHGVSVTVNFNGHFCQELEGHPLYRKIYPDFKGMLDEVCRHKIVACGNTGVGWVAAAAGVPLMGMQPANSNMPDYRYETCGVKSLVEIIDQPDSDYCARRLAEEVNRVVVFTTGCYDIIHAGHIRHLEESRALGTKLIVGLNSDASVKRIKGDDRPVNNQNQRATVLQSIRYVDEVRLFDGENALDIIKELKPDVVTNGCDHKQEEVVGKEFVEQYGGRVIITGGTRDQSSTKIIAAVVRIGDVLKAVQDGSSMSLNPWSKLKLLADQFMTVSSLPGDVADLGAYRGGTSLILKRLASHKDLHLFDTWEGNPYQDPLCHHGKGDWKADLGACKAFVGEDERTHYHAGVFPDSARELNGRMFCFALIDPDTYPAVRDAIEWFWPRMVQGGKLFFDDYDWPACAGVKKAIDEIFPSEQQVVYPASHTCVVIKK